MSPDKKQARLKLNNLRDSPAGTQNASEDVLALIYSLLVYEGSPQEPHWFCARADQLTLDAATFLLRLHAYNSVRVVVWRSHLQACLSNCAECVRAMQEAKITSRHTYFGAFSDPILKKFYESVAAWEVKVVLEGLAEAKIDPALPSESRRSLSDAPPALTYLMLSDYHILQDPKVIAILQSCPPKRAFSEWPTDIPPIGLLLLLMHESPNLRNWARSQVLLFKSTPMKSEQFLPMYTEVLERTATIVGRVDSHASTTGSTMKDTFPFCSDSSQLWSGFGIFLRFVPRERFRPSELFRLDLRRIIIGHLSDPGLHFSDVLRCFVLILNRIGPEVWQGEGQEYPLVIFSTIRDNPNYIETIRSPPNVGQDPWTLVWLHSFLKSLDRLPAFKDVLPVMMQFLCEELQHERFSRIRPNAIGIASKILYAIISYPPHSSSSDVSKGPLPADLSAAWESLDIHATTFVSVAFGKAYTSDQWKEHRAQARELIKATLILDIKHVATAIARLSNPARYTDPIVIPAVRSQLWKKIYENIHHDDAGGIAIIFQVLAQISHVDTLTEAAFRDLIKQSAHPTPARDAFTAINSALETFRSGFSDAASRLADFSSSTTMLRLLRQGTVTQDIMTLMFSPVEDIQQAAQSVAGLALDVETRQECFRALITTAPNHALAGMFTFLETFNHFAQTVPEACSVSKSLALCFTDVIDVMCSNPDGLLLKEKFLKSIAAPGAAEELPKLWTLMTKALSCIFLRTPRWAVYFDNAVMIEWMRDALIFGRDLLAQRKVIESAALGPGNASAAKRKLSHIGKKMVDDLQLVLLELTRWLRLTDEELLFQSFALLQSLLGCFRESNVAPSETTLQKLQKHLDDARKKDPSRPQTRLDEPRLARLQDTLSSFEPDDEEEVQIISHTKPAIKDKARVKQEQLRLVPDKHTKPRHQEMVQARPLPTKKSTTFTPDDEKKLESASSSLPRFAKPKTLPSVTPSSSKPQVSTTKPTVVESSSSSDSESDGGGSGTLASLAEMQRTPTIKKPTERRQVKMLDLPGNGKNPALDRINRREDARRTGLRLKPDVSALHRTILSWDYNHDGPSPPGVALGLTRVPETFNNVNHYRQIFEPLLLSECWAQLQQSKDEPQEKCDFQIVSRQYTDDWSDLEGTITESVRPEWYLMDTDIVTLSIGGSPKQYLAKVQSYKTLAGKIQLSVRLLLPDGGPQINSTWQVAKVMSLTTLHREYAALMGLPYYDLCKYILRPELAHKPSIGSEEVRQTMSAYKLNEPQAKAVLNSMNTDGFSLIQGPPGTGKTSTICGLVQLFIARRPKPPITVHVGRTSGPADREPVKKILLCAPSNAAIDEITNRLKGGISGGSRKETIPKVVRVGAPKSMHVSVKDVSLDALVEQKLNSTSNAAVQDASSDIALLRSQLEAVREKRRAKLEEVTNVHDNSAKTSALEAEIKSLNKQRMTLTQQLDKLRDKQKSDHRALDALGRKLRYEVIQEADVICSTLAGAGHDLLEAFDFEMVVIDEAAQSIELSSLIPLKYRCNRCIMVGDPQQLPPTVISQEATRFGYSQSLFVRLQKRKPDAVHLLSIQYRMHPEISRLPSNLFYEGRLLDGPEMASKTEKPWHSNTKFGPYRFYNVSRGLESTGSFHSLLNRTESQVAVALYARLTQEYSTYDFDLKIGIVTMYRAQVGELRKAFEQRFGQDIHTKVDFNTVDGFQGQEKEVIILSCVRAGPGLQNVGFLSDVRRMNVALTRAKSSVFILGHAATLERSDATWRKIVNDARERESLVDTDVTFFTSSGKQATSANSGNSKPSKPASRAAQPAHAPPPGLLTPQQLAASGRSAPPSHPSRLTDVAMNGEGSSSGSAILAPNPRVVSKKRAIEEEADEPAPSHSNHVREIPQQQKPKAKRQKAAPSLFIPKKR
ncbi:SEN1 N terminal-domain-containing protein [Cristinia sonorae]|uniref:SEN1 N terminal-domain-containing protein n=1 Tax=Cristinia sonorae TaxID=1940300 RepID=A0A8K0XSS0_9AGAR|nr:SEN1 N terminal-domain-containing protein [Cristinia sonorae]